MIVLSFSCRFSLLSSELPSLKLTWPLKMDGWNTSFLLGWPVFRGYVSFREGVYIEFIYCHLSMHKISLIIVSTKKRVYIEGGVQGLEGVWQGLEVFFLLGFPLL